MSKTIIEIILIILICFWLISFIIIFIGVDNKPKKYYKIEYSFDGKGKSETVVEAKTPEKAIRKLIRKYQSYFPLNELTDIISCTEIDFYKCLKEVQKDE